jgi:myo-inositol-1(or 4)-monophosphatase
MIAELLEIQSILHSAAETITRERQMLQRELKSDGSIVTNVDRAVEEFIRERLSILTPHAAVWGEEFGHADVNEHGQWQIDPIDGTTNFAYGSPLWGVTISYLQHGAMQLGGIFLPDLNETYLAKRGAGAFRNGQLMPMIEPGALLAHDPISVCDHIIQQYGKSWFRGKSRCAGAFVIDGTFAATGRYRALIGMDERLYDVGGSLVIASEVGLEIAYADGTEFDLVPLAAGRKIAKPWVIAPVHSGLPGSLQL